MKVDIPTHFTVVCLFVFFFLGYNKAETSMTTSDTSRIAAAYFHSHDTIFYEPVCASGKNYVNAEVAKLDGAAGIEKGHCSSYSKVTCAQPNRFWIAEVGLNGMREASGSSGYTNSTHVIFELYRMENIISLFRKPDTGVQQWKVWIDFNSNQLFEKDEIIVDAVAKDIAIPFDLPETAKAGSLTRMRVYTGLRGTDLNGNAITAGEVEDYTVHILD